MATVPLTGLPASSSALALADLLVIRAALTPVLVAANTTEEQAFVIPGIPAGNYVATVSKPIAQAGLGIVNVRVSAADTVAITFSNNTAAGITPTAAEVYTFLLVRVA